MQKIIYLFLCDSSEGEYKQSPIVSLLAAKNGAEEELYHIATEVKQLEQNQRMGMLGVKPAEELLASLANYMGDLQRYIRNHTTSASEDWKEKESRELSDLVQARIKYLQVVLGLQNGHSIYIIYKMIYI